MSDEKQKNDSDFARASKNSQNVGFVSEFVGFLKENKKWWLAPIIILMLLFGLLTILAATGAAPWVYTLF